MKKILTLAAGLMLTGCSMLQTPEDDSMQRYDANTRYQIIEIEGGFHIEMNYRKPQEYVEYGAVSRECRRQLVKIANEHAASVGQSIQRIAPGAITSLVKRYSPELTQCDAEAEVFWAQ